MSAREARDRLAAQLPSDVWVRTQTLVPSQSGVGVWLLPEQATALADRLEAADTLRRELDDALATVERVKALCDEWYAAPAQLTTAWKLGAAVRLRAALATPPAGGTE